MNLGRAVHAGEPVHELYVVAAGLRRERLGRGLARRILDPLAEKSAAVARSGSPPRREAPPDGLDAEWLAGGFRYELPRPSLDWMAVGLILAVLVIGLGCLAVPLVIGAGLPISYLVAGPLLILTSLALTARSLLTRHFVEIGGSGVRLVRSLGGLGQSAMTLPPEAIRSVLPEPRDKSRDRQLHALTLETARGNFAVGRGLTAAQAAWVGRKIQDMLPGAGAATEAPCPPTSCTSRKFRPPRSARRPRDLPAKARDGRPGRPGFADATGNPGS